MREDDTQADLISRVTIKILQPSWQNRHNGQPL
jgi:hypothetical protein